jgi:uncharacterized protein YfcZ (UPF0381/DUF406 family)
MWYTSYRVQPEIICDGKTGFVVDDVESAVVALKKIHSIHRTDCRQDFERRFTSERMAQDYLDVYATLLRPVEQLEPSPISSSHNKGISKRFKSAWLW